jgi:hypothetical protein
MGPPPTWRGWLAPGGGRPAGRVERSPPTRASSPHVDVWQQRCMPNHLKSWSAGLGVGAAGPWAQSAWGLAHLVHVSITPPW